MAVGTFDIIDHQVDQDYRRARSRSWSNRLRRLFHRRPTRLLPFREVRSRLHMQGQRDLGLQAVPLDQIVGSEGRANDFDRDFRPRTDKLRERWVRIGRARYRDEHLPAVQLFKVGDVYFVRDGNHRISVAKQLGQREIDAHVVELETNVPLTPDLDPEDLDGKAAQSQFVAKTDLLRLRPSVAVPMRPSDPATYDELLRHVEGHRYFMGIDLQREVSWDEAVGDWYDTVYLPQVEAMRRLHASTAFPGRTETNLFLSIMNHRHYVTEQLGEDPGPDEAVIDFMARFGPWRARRRFRRLRRAGSGMGDRLQQWWAWVRRGWGPAVAAGDG